MSIADKLEIFFKNKALYYKHFLDQLVDIDYILINLYNYGINDDKVSGDLDIIIDSNDYDSLANILNKEDFFPYIESNTNQIQWIKYIDNIGTVQVHVHLDLYYFNTKIIEFKQLEHKNHSLDINEEYILFCLQTFYKNKYNEKIYKKYNYFQDKINSSLVQNFLKSKYSHRKKYFLISINNIIKRHQPSKYSFFKILIQNDFFSSIKYLSVKFYTKIVKLLKINSNDIEIIFMGVDGAGKSTTIENIKTILNNEILYKQHYFGLKTSLVNKIRTFLSHKNKTNKIRNNYNKLNDKRKQNPHNIKKIYFLFIGIFYWMEYNIKYFILIKCNSIIPPTVHLIDRSYYDALLYYDINFLDTLYFKFSFKPDMIIYLTGDTNKLYERKLEISKNEIDFNKNKYNALMKKFMLNNFRLKEIDSTIKKEKDIENMISKTIFQLITKKV